MNAPELLEAVQKAGGSLLLDGERIRYMLPDSGIWMITELKQHRTELLVLLRRRQHQGMLSGVRLKKWQPKRPPIAIVEVGIVTDVHRFIGVTFQQLNAQLAGKDDPRDAKWSLRQLTDRLEQVGVEIELHAPSGVA